MKLYTEFEVKFAMDIARCQPDRTFDDVLEELTPIEIPTDEEIDEESPYVPNDASIDFWSHKEGFVEGAKWMRDKIQGGGDEKQ